jgi:hypothetical protein
MGVKLLVVSQLVPVVATAALCAAFILPDKTRTRAPLRASRYIYDPPFSFSGSTIKTAKFMPSAALFVLI